MDNLKDKFIVADGMVKHIKLPEGLLQDNVPSGVFKFDSESQVFTKILDRYRLPDKLYGDIISKAEMVMTAKEIGYASFLAIGGRGTGKTLLAHKVANKLIEDGYMVIEISDIGDLQYVSSLTEKFKIAVFVDELGKTIRGSNLDNSEQIVTIALEKIPVFIGTENGTSDIPEYVFGRPDRVAFRFDYTYLDRGVISDYVDDNLIPKKFKKEILSLLVSDMSTNFDILQTFIRLVNHFDMHNKSKKPLDIKLLYKSINKSKTSIVYKVVDVVSIEDSVFLNKSIKNKFKKDEMRVFKSDYGDSFNVEHPMLFNQYNLTPSKIGTDTTIILENHDGSLKIKIKPE